VLSTAVFTSFQQIFLDRDEHDLDLLVRAAAHELVIPDDFIDRKRHVLLGFERDDPFDFLFLHGRQFHEPRKDRLRRRGVIDRPALDSEFRSISRNAAAVCAFRRLSFAGSARTSHNRIGVQDQAAIRLGVKFTQPDRMSPQIEAENASRGRTWETCQNPKSPIPSKS
jgi:hypothetical protein